MAINKFDKLEKLEKEKEKLEKQASDLLKKAKQNKNNEVETKRGKLPEGDLWEEVFRLGQDCEAGKILKEKYPEVFKAYEKQNEKSKEIDRFFSDSFGFSFNSITPTRLIKFVSDIIDWKNEK